MGHKATKHDAPIGPTNQTLTAGPYQALPPMPPE